MIHHADARNGVFVGRIAEQDFLLKCATRNSDDLTVVYLHGMGGIGKSTLLRKLAGDAMVRRGKVTEIDLAIEMFAFSDFQAEVLEALAVEDAILLIDSFDRAQQWESWLRFVLRPARLGNALVVVASRVPPDVNWRTDPELSGTLKVIELKEMTDGEARTLIKENGFHHAEIRGLLDLASGHPLALVLAAEMTRRRKFGSGPVKPDAAFNGAVLDKVVGDLPSRLHRQALEVCALAESANEELLCYVIDGEVDEVFSWLRRLPYVEAGEKGIRVHSLIREVVSEDLRWRDPDRFTLLHQKIHSYLLMKVRAADDPGAMDAARNLVHSCRETRTRASAPVCQEASRFLETDYEPEDRDRIVGLVAQREGPESAAAVAYWLDRQPLDFHVYRAVDSGELVAFYGLLHLEKSDPDAVANDPVVAAIYDYVDRHGGTRDDGQILVSRFQIDLGSRVAPSGVVDTMQVRTIVEWIRSERMIWSFIAIRNPRVWSRRIASIGHPLIEEFPNMDGAPLAIHGHDWIEEPLGDWADRSIFGKLSGKSSRGDQGGRRSAGMSRADFRAAVRDALKNLEREDSLERNRLCTAQVAASGAELKRILSDAVTTLSRNPRNRKHFDALYATYFVDTPNQEASAARLGLPFSTYRRHLTKGIEEVSDWLWHDRLSSGGAAR
ncbi:hypothetical protein [Streptomyces sp. NPDC003857]